MKKCVFLVALTCLALSASAADPIFYESFNKNEDTGGNDGQWGGDVAKAIVVYFDNVSTEWYESYTNGANKCVKIGGKDDPGTLTTPTIACSGNITISFKAAPWVATKEDSVMTVSVEGGTLEQSTFELKKNKWNDISVKVFDVTSSVKISFKSKKNGRFFLDELKVFPADPNDPVLRLSESGSISFGTLGAGYSKQTHTINVLGQNLSDAGISVQLLDNTNSVFAVNTTTLPKSGGALQVSVNTGKPAGTYSAQLVVSATSANDASVKMEKKLYLNVAIVDIALQGAGTKENPYTVTDMLNLWDAWVLFEGDEYWVRGYILGGASVSGGELNGISKYDTDNIVLAASASETSVSKMLPVQIKSTAKTNLNVYNNSSMIGKEIFVFGPAAEYLGSGRLGIKDVKTEEQYVILTATAISNDQRQTTNDQLYNLLGLPVDENYKGIVIQNGHKYLRQ